MSNIKSFNIEKHFYLFILIIVLITITTIAFGQDDLEITASGNNLHTENYITYYSSISHFGLKLRSEPDQNSKVLTWIDFNEVLERLDSSAIADEVIINDKVVKGSWIFVKTSSKIKGYVFDQYVLGQQRSYRSANRYHKSWDHKDTYVNYKDFKLIIYGNQRFAISYSGDTIFFEQMIFDMPCDKLMEIQPKIAVDKIEVFYTYNEWMREQFNMNNYPDWKELHKEIYADWSKTRVFWEGHEPFRAVLQQNNFFRLPILDYSGIEQQRKSKFGLRDTMVNLSGEADNIATVVYKNQACEFRANRLILKIVLHTNDKKTITKYLDILLPWGC